MNKSPFSDGMILVGEKKSRKGEGATAILNLMSSTLDFLDKVDVCIEAVVHPANKKQLEGYKAQVENMYTEMAEMSKGAIHQMSNEEAVEAVGEAVEDVDDVAEDEVSIKVTDAPIQTEQPITMVNAPVVPKL